RFDNHLLAAPEIQPAERIADGDLPIQQAERGRAILCDFERELRAANNRRHLRGADLELIRLVAMEKVENALEEIEAAPALALAFNADEAARADPHCFQIGKTEQRLAVFVRAQAVARIKHLVSI